MAEPIPVTFGELLRQLRLDNGLTLETLADRARVAVRTISDLELGKARSPRESTVARLAWGLRLEGPAKARFIAIARGRPVPNGLPATTGTSPPRTLPRDVGSFTGRAFGARGADRGSGRRSLAGGGRARDQRDGRDRQDGLGRARGSPARRPVPRRPDFPRAAGSHAGAAAGGGGGGTGHPAADGRRRRPPDPGRSRGTREALAALAGRQADAIAAGRRGSQRAGPAVAAGHAGQPGPGHRPPGARGARRRASRPARGPRRR